MSLARGGIDLMQINRSILVRGSYANIGDYVALTKPRVMSLVVFTALVGLMVAPGGIEPFAGVVALFCIAAGAGAAGALPPVIGWVAAAGNVGLEPLILFLIIFLWTPPHFWALSLNLAGEYARAGVPMLPVVAGRAETKRQILLYSVLLAPVSLLPWALGFAGAIYGAAAAVLGAIMIFLSWQVRRSNDRERQPARRLFVFSILYLV